MAGRTSLSNTTMMTRPALLRASAGDALTCAAAQAAFYADEAILRGIWVSDPLASPSARGGGVMYAARGLLRVMAVPTGGALPNLAVYALFVGVPGDPIRLAFAEPESGATKASHGATVLELRDPPGDCRLTVLSSAAADIYYSQTV
jgi:hypothetical protein